MEAVFGTRRECCKGSPATVIRELEKSCRNSKLVNQNLLRTIQPEGVEVEIRLVAEEGLEGIEEAQLDEMWSYVGKKANQRWLWHAIDRITGQVERLHFWTTKR